MDPRISKPLGEAEYDRFTTEGYSPLLHFLELVPSDLSGKCSYLGLPPVSGFSPAISEGICVSAAAIEGGLNRFSGDQAEDFGGKIPNIAGVFSAGIYEDWIPLSFSLECQARMVTIREYRSPFGRCLPDFQ